MVKVAAGQMDHGTGAATSGAAGAGREHCGYQVERNGATGRRRRRWSAHGWQRLLCLSTATVEFLRCLLAVGVGPTRGEVPSTSDFLKLSLYEDRGDAELRG